MAAWLWSLTALSLVAAVSVPLYRLFLHPLASIPGPPVAAITRLYAFYFNVIQGGKFYLEIERLHHVYGPVVRIAPNEVHLSTAEHYDKIYAIGSRYSKDGGFYGVMDTKFAIFSTVSNELHRRRRAPLEPFFSRRTVLELEGIVRAKADKLCRLLGAAMARRHEFNLHAALRAVSMDVTTDYAFADCWDQLDRDDLGQWYPAMVKNSGIALWVLQQFPFVLQLVDAIPPRIARRLSPIMRDTLDCKEKTRCAVEHVQQSIDSGYKPRQRTLFHDLLNPEIAASGHRRPTIDEMAEEAFSICAAASDTTGNAMTVAAYHVITNPTIYARLREELLARFPDSESETGYAELEKLPYLTGIVKEGLRLSYGVIGRLPRVVPRGGAEFDGFYLPEGTVVGMSTYMQHRNLMAFPEPAVFEPRRWIVQETSTIGAPRPAVANKCLVPFSRGSRSCIGQNLAMCELYVTLGTMFRRFGNLAARDVGELTYIDYFNPFHPDPKQKLSVFAAG